MAHNVTEFYARNTLTTLLPLACGSQCNRVLCKKHSNYSTATGVWLNTNSLSVVSITLILINFIKILCTATGVDIQVQSVKCRGCSIIAEWHDNITAHADNVITHGWQCHHIADSDIKTSHHMLTMSSHRWQWHHDITSHADNGITTSHHMLTMSSHRWQWHHITSHHITSHHMADNIITSLTMSWQHHITWLAILRLSQTHASVKLTARPQCKVFQSTDY